MKQSNKTHTHITKKLINKMKYYKYSKKKKNQERETTGEKKKDK